MSETVDVAPAVKAIDPEAANDKHMILAVIEASEAARNIGQVMLMSSPEHKRSWLGGARAELLRAYERLRPPGKPTTDEVIGGLKVRLDLAAITLETNMNTFREYAGLHRAKGTEDGEAKAKRNEELAAHCEKVLAVVRPKS